MYIICPLLIFVYNVTLSMIFMPPRSKIGAYCFCPVCHSVILSVHVYQHFWPCDLDLGIWSIFWKLLTMPITFQQWVPEFSYFTWIFLVKRSFCWYETFWPWLLLKKNTIIHNKMINIRAFILHVSISCDKIKVFVLVTLVIFGFTTYHVDDVQIQKGLKEVTEYFHYWGVLARI